MISILGIPFDAASSFLRGPAQAPNKIRAAFHSDSANYFTERGIDLKESEIWSDAGDLAFNGENPLSVIENSIHNLLAQDHRILTLGGDHSISYPVVKAFAKKYGRLNILHIDAHGDLYDSFEGDKYSHACPFARIMEEELAVRLVQVGIRTLSTHQREQAARFGVEIIEMKDWNSAIQFQFHGPTYVSLDLDAIDPAFAPGVSHHEPGGFTSREVFTIIQKLKGNLVGADLVEFNPTRDPSGITAMLAAKLFKELLDRLLLSENG
ncbi:MAG: agmatinase [Cyclobacteriaceae bacterium]|nr:agmatinase [Cyclobacteriaceae bacterium]